MFMHDKQLKKPSFYKIQKKHTKEKPKNQPCTAKKKIRKYVSLIV